jgi:hypothetical protein
MMEKSGDSGEGAGLKRTAREVRGKIRGRETEDEDTDESYSSLCGICFGSKRDFTLFIYLARFS